MKIVQRIFKKQINKAVNTRIKAAVPGITHQIAAQLNFGGFGHFGGGGSGGEKRRNGLANSGELLGLDHSLLRRNARKAYHQTPQARTIVDRFADTVAHIGLKVEPSPKHNLLGISPEEAEDWASNVEERFDSWAKSKEQHRAGTMSFYQSHRLYQIYQHRDNDIFNRLYYSNDKSLLNPLQFQMIDPDQIIGGTITNTLGYSSKFSDGIIRNAQGKETGYKVFAEKYENPGSFETVEIPAKIKDRRFMLHGYISEYAGQGRGYSRLAHILQDFENMTDFELAHIEKAIAHSILAFTVESEAGKTPMSIDLDAPAGQELDAGIIATSNPITNTTVDASEVREATIKTAGAKVVYAPQGGQKLNPVSQTAPIDTYESFLTTLFTFLSSSASMPPEVALMKFGSNYSASRGALILYWSVAERFREEMATDYLNPVYEMWLSEEIAAGRIQAPGWSDPVLRAAWLNCSWIGVPMPNIDPLKTANSEKVYMELGATTGKRVASEKNGSKFDRNVSRLKREVGKLPKLPWTKQASSSGGEDKGKVKPSKNDDDKEDEDNE